ncbi:uncharacterized protein LOC110160727 [Boleophthalmus pectinirostris]|uniref:uncharacterized protein LOC110160727 n=1 Tax=Boleophthalmus pectinirostris TaxID=150288 RepID=UPI0024309DA1|nr:uncharacterized protein LOC110160727 [Boleophthalmus pectinirostris]
MLFQVTVFVLLDFCSSYSTPFECYGGTYTFTIPRTDTSVYYMPNTRDNRILVVDNGKSVNTRFEVSFMNTIKMKDLTEQDDRAILFFDQLNSVQLSVGDCVEPLLKRYGDLFSWRIPRLAQYLEFAQTVSVSVLKPIVIWNRTDPSSTRGVINDNDFEIYKLTQKNSGYYKFRGSRNDLIKWKKIEVEENREHLEYFEGEHFHMDFPVEFSFSNILFTPATSQIEKTIEKRRIRNRMKLTNSYVSFRDLTLQDTGIYKFIDNEGNVAVMVQLDVRKAEVPVWAYIVIVCVILLGILLCCCCVKKCCCKKSERSEPGSTNAAAPAVYYHDSNQSAPPAIPLLSREPKHFTADTTVSSALKGPILCKIDSCELCYNVVTSSKTYLEFHLVSCRHV